ARARRSAGLRETPPTVRRAARRASTNPSETRRHGHGARRRAPARLSRRASARHRRGGRSSWLNGESHTRRQRSQTLRHRSRPAVPEAPFVDRLCPTITVACPETTQAGATVIFTAQILGAGPDPHLTFAWSISGGAITDGQGTPVIKVDTTGLSGQPITATIE